MLKLKVIILWIIVLLIIIYGFNQMPQNEEVCSSFALKNYYDQIVIQNEQLLVEFRGCWILPKKVVLTTLCAGIIKGEMLEDEITVIPGKVYPFRLVKKDSWDVVCYLDFETGIVYLSKVMEAGEEKRYRSIRLGDDELVELKNRLESNLLKFRSEQ